MRLLLIGYGRMGKLVDELSGAYDFEVAGRLDIDNNRGGAGISPDQVRGVDVAIDFSTADAVYDNLPRLAAHGVNLVVGTTGWQSQEGAMRRIAADAGIGVVAAANFSLGVNLFLALTERAAELFGPRPEFGAWIHELHHAAKIDAPSGTALAMQHTMTRCGYTGQIAMASSRAGSGTGHPHRGVRRPGRVDRADPRCPGPRHVRPRRPGGGALGARSEGMVFHASGPRARGRR